MISGFSVFAFPTLTQLLRQHNSYWYAGLGDLWRGLSLWDVPFLIFSFDDGGSGMFCLVLFFNLLFFCQFLRGVHKDSETIIMLLSSLLLAKLPTGLKIHHFLPVSFTRPQTALIRTSFRTIMSYTISHPFRMGTL
jgi:hypothetical protein